MSALAYELHTFCPGGNHTVKSELYVTVSRIKFAAVDESTFVLAPNRVGRCGLNLVAVLDNLVEQTALSLDDTVLLGYLFKVSFALGCVYGCLVFSPFSDEVVEYLVR